MDCRTYILCIFFSSYVIALANQDGLNNILKSYETLHSLHMKHKVVKRSTDGLNPTAKQLEFKTLGRQFNLYLQKKTRLFSRDFRIVAVNGKNEKTEVPMNVNAYEGHLVGEAGMSEVHAIWEDDDTISATIKTRNETYVLEPSWRHLPDSSNYSMITYKASDMNMEQDFGKNYCGYVDVNKEENLVEDQLKREKEAKEKPDTTSKRRDKRQTYGKKTTCQLYLVADYRFYQEMGDNKVERASSYLIGLIDRVDAIYRETLFGGNGHSQMGFEIKEILIHTEPTPTSKPQGLHYNMDRKEWNTRELLNVFSTYSSNRYCLAHLFTSRYIWSDTSGIMGLGFIATPSPDQPGGICSRVYYSSSGKSYLNSGWTSSLNRHGRRLLTLEADLVTTHEFGHNWGSEHDPDTSDCSPSAMDGGKFVMYTYSVSGYDPNNKVFSPCSKRSIGQVLDSKADKCFSTPQDSYCGNSRVEDGEECDAGPVNVQYPDRCCDENCKLRDNAVCSDMNHICCQDCQVAPKSTICAEPSGDDDASCDLGAECDGMNKECPESQKKPDLSPCLSNGHCMGGVCKSYCERNNLIPCVCDSVEDSCSWCCRNATQHCVPFLEINMTEPLKLQDGMPCVQGYCNEGRCEKQVQDLIERFWKVIENLTPSQFVAFMKANIVGTVIILSLIIWIPASCIVSWKDRQNAKKMKEETEWHRPDNPNLVTPGMENKIRKRAVRTSTSIASPVATYV